MHQDNKDSVSGQQSLKALDAAQDKAGSLLYEGDFIKTPEAASLLYTTTGALRTSRTTGTLFGKPTPRYIKRGGKVGYKRETLDAFNAQFHEQANTTQNVAAA